MTTGRKLGPIAAAVLLSSSAAASAAQPIPLQAGTYCGGGDARIVVDVAHDRVEIDHLVCSFPVIAADHLQSDLCSTPDGKSVERNFDFRVFGRDFWHTGQLYRICGPVPAELTNPLSAAPPGKTGG